MTAEVSRCKRLDYGDKSVPMMSDAFNDAEDSLF